MTVAASDICFLYTQTHICSLEKCYSEKVSPTSLNGNVFLREGLTNEERLHQLKDYFKFIMLRNPLERLVSAYRDKIEPPLEFSDHDREADPLIMSIRDVSQVSYTFRNTDVSFSPSTIHVPLLSGPEIMVATISVLTSPRL